MNIGSGRVSTEDHNPDLYLAARQPAGCTRIFTDKATDVHVKRPQLTRCLATLHAGDTLIVWKLDRLGRARRDLLTLLDELKARDVAFRSLTEAIDPPSSGRALWQTVGIMAELERSLIQEPTRADRVAAQAGGVQRGRKPLLSAQLVAHARTLLAQGERPVHAVHLLKVSRGARWNGRCVAEAPDTSCTRGATRVMRTNTPREPWGERMQPRELVHHWVDACNRADVDALTACYTADAINHQVAEAPGHGRAAIRRMFGAEFATATMVCLVKHIFEEGEWAILEWRDPLGLRGCGFFHIINSQIVLQRGYWDKLTFLRLQGLPVPRDL